MISDTGSDTKLLLDMGNTRLKWGLWDSGWQSEGNLVADDDIVGRIESAFAGLPKPDSVWLASMAAAERIERLDRACTKIFGFAPQRVRTPAMACGVRCAYTDPARLGIDRWLAAVAAFRATGGPAVAFDCGTAITMDAVTADGEHLGGLIVPGVQLMRRALYGATANIPDEGDSGEGAGELFARDTRAAVSAGSLHAAAAFLRHTAAAAVAQLGPATRVLLTGGDAERLRLLLDESFEWRPRLVLEGLLAMAEELACASC